MYGRVNHDVPVLEHHGYIPMVWSRDRNSSFSNFMECLNAWGAAAKEDPEIDIVSEFNFTSLDDSESNRTKLDDFKEEVRNLQHYAVLEDMF